MTKLAASGAGEHPPSYIIFLVVFLFFLTGLLGFLICHLLKKKGYRCRTRDLEDEEDKLGEDEDDENEENQDTVEQILKCIMENEANMEAFNEMLGNHSVCVRHDQRLRKESIGGIPPHLHTVHSGTDLNSCLLCAQVKAKRGRRQSRTPRFKQRPGEQTVFSVGRFRVTHSDKKLQGSPNLLAVSGDQLDQSQDSEERKEDGYNLKNMFKEVQPPSDGANGVAANAGKRKKSVTIFGLRRGSDPSGLRVKERVGRDTGGSRFAVQQPPVVLEEPVQAESVEANPECGTKAAAKLNTESASAQREGITSILKKSSNSNSGSQESSRLGLQGKMAVGASVPSSLPVSPGKSVEVNNKILKIEDPGPLQTSTPNDTIPAPIPGFTSVMPTGQSHWNKDFTTARVSSDPCSSPDPEPAASGGLALISLGSSPASSFQNKTFSSVSSLKTPTSSLAESPSPKSSLGNLPEATRSKPLAPLPPCSSPTAASPRSTLKSESLTSVRSTTYGDILPSSYSTKEHKLEGQTEENIEKKRPGIIRTPKLPPVAAGDLASSSEQVLKDRQSSLPLTPPSLLSSSSLQGGRVSSVTIVKASPDSKREFSVITMVDKEEASSSDQRLKSSQDGFKSEREETNPTVRKQEQIFIGESQTQRKETSGGETRSYPGQDKDDMMEMEDIRDCKVTQVEGAEGPREDTDKMLDNQSQQNQEGKCQDDEVSTASRNDPSRETNDTKN
ncbi:RELT-like protein 2 isoform X1 [Xiphophorus couchianus]|uniref:RELT-like protein 2 isoform X1 n=1 Tax=Xiphophorus couchianus TaxID=32473 RepID=UPI0010160037|nr:nucleolar and coiled-body phosphoprotein 1-like isoform X1 [Xiphophorus couchianus]XP_027887224.1 nucleolar and coiled-body phosphoprotein 1-like isoform X1 [Xiphophorus couchianus]XP_027887225.1 nucleolar and coiled-body phosphoprotein 1-like isoform X1 [Xiphophorus couchianus]